MIGRDTRNRRRGFRRDVVVKECIKICSSTALEVWVQQNRMITWQNKESPREKVKRKKLLRCTSSGFPTLIVKHGSVLPSSPPSVPFLCVAGLTQASGKTVAASGRHPSPYRPGGACCRRGRTTASSRRKRSVCRRTFECGATGGSTSSSRSRCRSANPRDAMMGYFFGQIPFDSKRLTQSV